MSTDPAPVRVVHLSEQAGAYVVRPASSDPAGRFRPFPLPPVPASLSLWLVTLCERFQAISGGRALCATLMLDPGRRRWAHPHLPRQRCCADGVSWTLDRADFAGRPPHLAVAGSFQLARHVGTLDEVLARVPSHVDGLHVVQVLSDDGGHWAGYAAVTAGGVVRAVDPGDFLVDDWLAALSEGRGRLELA